METIVEKTPQQILTEAADLLEEEGRWGRGRLFNFQSNFQEETSNQSVCMMCAHGAIAYCGEPKVKSRILEGKKPFYHFEFAHDDGKNDRNRHLYKNVQMAHWMAAKAGLTTQFNDAKNRTQQEVIAKLREAANQ